MWPGCKVELRISKFPNDKTSALEIDIGSLFSAVLHIHGAGSCQTKSNFRAVSNISMKYTYWLIPIRGFCSQRREMSQRSAFKRLSQFYCKTRAASADTEDGTQTVFVLCRLGP